MDFHFSAVLVDGPSSKQETNRKIRAYNARRQPMKNHKQELPHAYSSQNWLENQVYETTKTFWGALQMQFCMTSWYHKNLKKDCFVALSATYLGPQGQKRIFTHFAGAITQ